MHVTQIAKLSIFENEKRNTHEIEKNIVCYFFEN